MGKRRISQNAVAEIGAERISILMGLARTEAHSGKTERARRYVDLSRRISGKTKSPMPRDVPYCNRCLVPLMPGFNCRVRVDGHMVRTTCGECGSISRRPYIREQSHERKGRQEGADEARE